MPCRAYRSVPSRQRRASLPRSPRPSPACWSACAGPAPRGHRAGTTGQACRALPPPCRRRYAFVNPPHATASGCPLSQDLFSSWQSRSLYLQQQLYACLAAGLVEDALVGSQASSPKTSWLMQGMGVHDNKRSVSNERHMTRGSIARSSINPLTLLVGAIGNAVEHVANSVEHSEGFRTLVHKCAAWQSPLLLHCQGIHVQ